LSILSIQGEVSLFTLKKSYCFLSLDLKHSKVVSENLQSVDIVVVPLIYYQ